MRGGPGGERAGLRTPSGIGAAQTFVFDSLEALEPFGAAWDAMPARRGPHADFHDTYAWFAAWNSAARPGIRPTLRVVAVFDGEEPVALLPLVARTAREWESAGRELRSRFRPVVGSERPDPEVLGLLAQEVGRAGTRDLMLYRLPSRDPVTRGLASALRETGFFVRERPRSSECLASVQGGWDEHRKRFASFGRMAEGRVTKASRLWDVSMETYGGADGLPVLQGFESYADVHGRSWKGELGGSVRAHRVELLRRMELLGGARVYVLRIAGVAAAAHIWFRVGPVASWLSTAYDRRLAALAPGTIAMWWAQERLFREKAPEVLDFLPGRNPQKDRLGPDRPPLVELEAVRKTVVSGITFLDRHARHVSQAVAGRVRRLTARKPGGAPPTPVRWVDIAGRQRALPSSPLALDAPTARFLAVAGGFPSRKAMEEAWHEGDEWWSVGEEPRAIVRLGRPTGSARPVREVVLVDSGGGSVDDLLVAVSAAVGERVSAFLPAGSGASERGHPIPIRRAPLPWPAALQAR